MGITLSTPNYIPRKDNLLFPPETLDKIVNFLTPRDLCVAREVCLEWTIYITESGVLAKTMGIKVEKSEYVLQNLAESPLPCTFDSFFLHNLELTRPTLPFWKLYSDTITHLEFTDCAILPRNSSPVGQNDPTEFSLGCPNLKHLSLKNMDKYFMMGGQFLQLNEILCLENLEYLDLSNNNYLSDQILFAVLQKTEKLKSLSLSSCQVIFVRAVHNRFYGKHISRPPYSDNILSFETLVVDFLRHTRGSYLRELKLRSTLINSQAIQLISDPDIFHWESLDLTDCRELKAQDYVQFIKAQSETLHTLILSTSSKNLSNRPFIEKELNKLEKLELAGCREIKTLQFVKNMPNIQHLNVSCCEISDINVEDFSNVLKLKSLNLNSLRLHSDEGLRNLCSKLNQLTVLNLAECGSWVTDNLMQSIIVNLRSLKMLNIQRTPVTDRGLAGTEIDDFEETRFPSNIVEAKRIALQERLRSIPDGHCLSELQSLQELNISHCQSLGQATWKIALKLPSLAKLDVSGCCQITPKGVLAIAVNCPSLEDLSLLNCGSQITSQPELVQNITKSLYRLRRFVI